MSLTTPVRRPEVGHPVVLPAFLVRAAHRWPDHPALDIPPAPGRDRVTVSYAVLDGRSSFLARTVHGFAGPGDIVALLLPRTSEWLYIAQLAVLKSGAAYICLDPAFPDEHLRYILDDSRAVALVTDAAGRERVDRLRFTGAVLEPDRVVLEPDRVVLESGPALEAPRGWSAATSLPPPEPDDLAYVIYTSGTTSRPKGVMIPHRGIANLIAAGIDEFGLGPGDRIGQVSAATFDSSVEEIWMGLATGATVVVMDDATARLGPDLVPWLRRERITVLSPPPTLLRTTGCLDPARELPDLRLLYVGGEALTQDVADRWATGRRLVNGYGPTECSVTCLWHDIVPGEPVAIGWPVPGVRAWVLDANLQPVAPGEQGELCIGGEALAVGYLNNPALTAERFSEHPTLGRLYRTGDLVHADSDGLLYYHGRIDSQVKLRGYRIELEAVETCLVECPGVREAACRVQGEDAAAVLAAHVVPMDAARPPHPDELRRRLAEQLPPYMVPARFGFTAEMPRSTSGKLRRDALPVLMAAAGSPGPVEAHSASPCDPVQEKVATAVTRVLSLPGTVGVEDDFFTQLGGSSLHAAMLVSELRLDDATAAVTVRDVYEARTVAALSRLVVRAGGAGTGDAGTGDARTVDARTVDARTVDARTAPVGVLGARPAAVTVVQTLWRLLEIGVGSAAAYLTVFVLGPLIADRIGLSTLVLLLPVIAMLTPIVLSPLAVLATVLAKRLLIGRYLPGSTPVWSGAYLRMWIVGRVAGFIPWGTIAGTELQCRVLRALGAQIGERVHLHRGVDLHHGGWDLLEIGDDVTVGQDAALRVVHLEQGHVVLGRVTIADGATLDVRAGVAPGTRVGRNAWLSALSSLPAGGSIPDGETWDGVPARRVGPAPEPPPLDHAARSLTPLAHGLVTIFATGLVKSLPGLPAVLVVAALARGIELRYATALSWLTEPGSHLALLAAGAVLACLSGIAGVWSQALVARALGRVGEKVISRWSLAYVRVWLKTGLVTSANEWLSGGLFWPVWLRWAGMRIGRDAEISTITDTVPELVEIGPRTFLADGIYLGGPRVHRGTVTLRATTLSRNTFLGNHVVIAGGQRLPADLLLGVCTVADDRVMRSGTSWFGHPAFELPRREVVELDRGLTDEPSTLRVVNRVFWEWLRFAVPLVPAAVGVGWMAATAAAAARLGVVPLLLVAVPVLALAGEVALALFVLALKWVLLGRVRPGVHGLWSCWCSRWDFLYVAWGKIASRVLSPLEGTLLLPVYLRGTGMRIGRRVVLGDGFAQVVDPDMIEIEDGATVSAMFQAHTFEDRVLKIDHVRIGAGATLAEGTVPLYGADVGERTTVSAHSVIMKRERLLPDARYEGVPTRCTESPW